MSRNPFVSRIQPSNYRDSPLWLINLLKRSTVTASFTLIKKTKWTIKKSQFTGRCKEAFRTCLNSILRIHLGKEINRSSHSLMSLFDVEYLYWYCRSKSGCGEERKLCPFCHSVAEWQKRILDQYYWFVTLFAILVRQWSCSRFPWLFVFYCRFCFCFLFLGFWIQSKFRISFPHLERWLWRGGFRGVHSGFECSWHVTWRAAWRFLIGCLIGTFFRGSGYLLEREEGWWKIPKVSFRTTY